MPQAYSDPSRESDEHSLPDIEVFQRTAEECALDDEDLVFEYMKRREFRMANMNGRDSQAMVDAIIEEEGIRGGWFWQACFPGCLPDGDAVGPFDSYAEALADAQSNN